MASIQTLSVLDSKVADILERVAPHVFDGKLVFQYSVKKIVPYEDLLEIDGLGIVRINEDLFSECCRWSGLV